jgi:hypothetical protein
MLEAPGKTDLERDIRLTAQPRVCPSNAGFAKDSGGRDSTSGSGRGATAKGGSESARTMRAAPPPATGTCPLLIRPPLPPGARAQRDREAGSTPARTDRARASAEFLGSRRLRSGSITVPLLRAAPRHLPSPRRWKHQSAQADLARHRDIAPHRAPREERGESGEHRDAGARAVPARPRARARGCRTSSSSGMPSEAARFASERRLRAFLHHVAELACEDQLPPPRAASMKRMSPLTGVQRFGGHAGNPERMATSAPNLRSQIARLPARPRARPPLGDAHRA